MDKLIHPMAAQGTTQLWMHVMTENTTHVHYSQIDLIHRSYNAPVPYLTMHHSEQKCAHFFSEWCIVRCRIGALWDFSYLVNWSATIVVQFTSRSASWFPWPRLNVVSQSRHLILASRSPGICLYKEVWISLPSAPTPTELSFHGTNGP